MEVNINSIKNGILRKFPMLGATMSRVKFEVDNTAPTAETDGETVYFNEMFVNSLNYGQKVFLFSHELMHIAFDHILRSKDKNHEIWNEATDAVINQMLQAENLPMINGGVDIAEAIDKSAEEMYILLKEKENNNQNDSKFRNKGNSSSNGSGESENENGGSGNNQQNSNQNVNISGDNKSQDSQNNEDENCQNVEPSGKGGHKLWEIAVKKAEKNAKKNGKVNDKKINEKTFLEENAKLKDELAKKALIEIKQNSTSSSNMFVGMKGTLGSVGNAKAVVSWKKLLRKELEKEEDRWSYRRANEENDFQASIDTLEVDERAITEVLLDTSGSVSDILLKNFLRQTKNIIKDSKLFVGCFDTYFYGFTEIKTEADIDNFKIVGRGGTNFNEAVRAFSKDHRVNKIVFTDGYGSVTDNKISKATKNLYWLIWQNKDFSPCCGKVIFVDAKDLFYNNKSEEMCK